MTTDGSDSGLSQLSEGSAPPRRNGELVFQEPWEGRAFGVAAALNQAGLCAWRDFSHRLASEITVEGAASQADRYYRHWLTALEALAVESGLVGSVELETKTSEYLSRAREDGHH